MEIDFRRPRHIRGFRLGEVLVWDFTNKPLVEKTVSGTIASFADGADDVPIKSLVCNVDANLSGVSSVGVVHGGINVLPSLVAGTYTENEVTATVSNDGVVTVTGRNNTGSPVLVVIPLSANVSQIAGKNIFCHIRNSISNSNIALRIKNHWPSFSSVNRIFECTNSQDTLANIGVQVGANVTSELNFTIQPSFEYTNTVTDFYPYKTPTTHTATLGRTIYGGSVDVVQGTGTENTSAITALNALSWAKTTVGGHTCFYAALPNGLIDASGIVGDCDTYDITTDGQMGTDGTIRFYCSVSYNFSRCLIRDDRYSELSASEFKSVVTGNIVYQLAESAQTDFTFTPVPINSFLGDNTLWADTGDIEVTYYAYAD